MEKGLTSAGLRFYASKDCHLLLQVTDDCDVDAIMNSANAERTAMSPGGISTGRPFMVKVNGRLAQSESSSAAINSHHNRRAALALRQPENVPSAANHCCRRKTVLPRKPWRRFGRLLPNTSGKFTESRSQNLFHRRGEHRRTRSWRSPAVLRPCVGFQVWMLI